MMRKSGDHRTLQKFPKFFDGKACLPDDGPQGAGLEVSAGMDRDCHGACRIGRMDEHVMAADDAINHEAVPRQRADDPVAADGRQAPAILGGYGYAADFGMRVGRNGHALVAPIGENGADRFLGIGERFLLAFAFGDNFRERRDQHCKAAAFLRLQYD